MVAPVRIELTYAGVKVPCLTTWQQRNMVDVRGFEPLSETHPIQTFLHDSPCYEDFTLFAGKGIRFRAEDVTVYIFLHHCILRKHRKHYADSSILKCSLSDKYIVLEALTQAAI